MEDTNTKTIKKLTAQTTAKELWTLLKVSSSLASTLDLTEVLQIAIESAADLLGFESGAIYTLENNLLYLGATTPALPPNSRRSFALRSFPITRISKRWF